MPLPRPLSTLLWLPLNLAQGVHTALWSAGWISVALVLARLAGPEPALALARRVWAPGLLSAAGAQLRVSGGERVDPARAAFFVANHQSWIDIPALFRALPLPLGFLAKRELATVPFLGRYLRATGMVLVERGDPRRAGATVGRAAELLAAGRSVLSFPEGTRSRDGRMAPFKPGGFGAAIATGAPVVPVALRGTGAVLPAGGFRVRPGVIAVRIGTPLASAPFAPADRAGLARAAERAVAELLGISPPAARRGARASR
jgi:1-acyl-sn-glycerol-3-phosphate acyltransferase